MTSRKRASDEDYNGRQAKNLGAPTAGSNDAARQADLEAASVADRARPNHTGTQTWATISDGDTAVRATRITQLTPPTAGGSDPIQANGNEVQNLKAGTSDTSAAQVGQVKALLSGVRKSDVRLVQTATNATLSGLSAVDGVTPAAGDRILVVGNGKDNGIYVAASGAWARAVDADEASEFATEWLVTVREGNTNADVLYTHATDGVVTLGTTVLTFSKTGPISSSAAQGVAVDIPATAAGATAAITHGLGTRDVIVQVRRTSAPWDDVDVADGRPDLNTVTILPDIAMAAGEYRALILKVA